MASKRHIVELKQSAQKELERLPNALIARIIAKLESLEGDPRPPGCKKLKGGDAEYRVRVGEYRIVHVIDDRATPHPKEALILGDPQESPHPERSEGSP